MIPSPPSPAELKAFRARHGLSQAALAERLGMSRRGVEGWEGGVRTPPSYLSLALAHLARGEPDWPAECTRGWENYVKALRGREPTAQGAFGAGFLTRGWLENPEALAADIGPAGRGPYAVKETQDAV
jgi:transcriptional regulator with XRE-family HTH domain